MFHALSAYHGVVRDGGELVVGSPQLPPVPLNKIPVPLLLPWTSVELHTMTAL